MDNPDDILIKVKFFEKTLHNYLINLYNYIEEIKTNYVSSKRTKTLILSKPIEKYMEELDIIYTSLFKKIPMINSIMIHGKIYNGPVSKNKGGFNVFHKSKDVYPVIVSIKRCIKNLNIFLIRGSLEKSGSGIYYASNLLSGYIIKLLKIYKTQSERNPIYLQYNNKLDRTDLEKSIYYSIKYYKKIYSIINTLMKKLYYHLYHLEQNIKYKTSNNNIKIIYTEPNLTTNNGKTSSNTEKIEIKPSVVPIGGTKKSIKKPTKKFIKKSIKKPSRN